MSRSDTDGDWLLLGRVLKAGLVKLRNLKKLSQE